MIDPNVFYKAVCKTTGMEWVIYSFHYSGYPKPQLSTVHVLDMEITDYIIKGVDEVDIIEQKRK